MEDLTRYNQYDFTQIRATTDFLQLVELLDEISTPLKMNHYALILFSDLSEAFDTVIHSMYPTPLHLLKHLNFFFLFSLNSQFFNIFSYFK